LAGKGARRTLEPVMYLGGAVLLHAFLFLIPTGIGKSTDAGTARGVRIRVIGEAPATSAARPTFPSAPPDRKAAPLVPPTAPSQLPYSSLSALGGEKDGQGPVRPGGPDGGTASAGDGGASDRTLRGDGDGPAGSEFGSYLARLRSEQVQGWARESAGRAKQGWKGSGKAGAGWGAGSGTGTGTGDGPGGKGGGKGDGKGYLDPRVQMVVTSYPETGIARRFTQVPYPDLKVKKHQVASGWWNVYIQILTDGDGRVIRKTVLRPETDGPRERMFVEQVQKEIDRWSFDRVEAEILVDVRFRVE